MLDDIGSSSRNIPGSTAFVGGYVTGLGDVPWTQAEWDAFPHAKHVRIAQGAGAAPAASGYDVIDVEADAVTPESASAMVVQRVHSGIQWTTIYGTDSTLAAVTAAIQARGLGWWDGHINYWLADWNLNESEAAALLGTLRHGAPLVGVQWASPTSNPNTVVPGGSQTLSQANIDISVVDANWIPSGGFTGNFPPPPPVKTWNGLLVVTDAAGVFHARAVTSTDDVHWS
jgi:hypothetical protein